MPRWIFIQQNTAHPVSSWPCWLPQSWPKLRWTAFLSWVVYICLHIPICGTRSKYVNLPLTKVRLHPLPSAQRLVEGIAEPKLPIRTLCIGIHELPHLAMADGGWNLAAGVENGCLAAGVENGCFRADQANKQTSLKHAGLLGRHFFGFGLISRGRVHWFRVIVARLATGTYNPKNGNHWKPSYEGWNHLMFVLCHIPICVDHPQLVGLWNQPLTPLSTNIYNIIRYGKSTINRWLNLRLHHGSFPDFLVCLRVPQTSLIFRLIVGYQ